MDVEDVLATTLHINARLDTEIENLSARLTTIETDYSSPGQTITHYCHICGKETSKEILCSECASRLRNILYPVSININELI